MDPFVHEIGSDGIERIKYQEVGGRRVPCVKLSFKQAWYTGNNSTYKGKPKY
jgi:hypothetical protein